MRMASQIFTTHAIVVPLELACTVIALQARRPPSLWLNVSANARDKLKYIKK
jgi:hypothetical protein